MEQKSISLSSLDTFSTGSAGQDILRYIGLPTILGHEKDTLCYFLGRNLSRKIDFDTLEDMYYIFTKLNWGNLELINEKKNSLTFHLMADDIVYRLKSPIETEFKLEAGFIAESIQHLKGRACECSETINKRLFRIEFKVVFTD